MCGTRDFVEMKRNEGDRGASKFLGKFLGVGRDFRKQGKVESQRLSEGKGSKRAKYRRNLEYCQVVARN